MKGPDWPPLVLRRATEGDLAPIVALERACFTHPWAVHQLREAVAAESSGGVLTLQAPTAGGQEVVAYCVVQLVADELSIHTLAVAPAWRRRGLGRWLLERALHAGARLGAATAFLEVRQSNWGALGLYRSLGFEVISSRKGYYEGPREDAFVLRRSVLETDEGRASRQP